MRHNPTEAESALRQHLRTQRHRSTGVIWRFQRVVLGYIPDFYCPSRRLVVEVDGGYHNEPEQRARDEQREALLAKHCKLLVLRFTNAEVLSDPKAVAERIYETAISRPFLKNPVKGLKRKLPKRTA